MTIRPHHRSHRAIRREKWLVLLLGFYTILFLLQLLYLSKIGSDCTKSKGTDTLLSLTDATLKKAARLQRLGKGNPHAPLFLFVIGTEGSGHALFQTIYRSSPSFQKLEQWNMFEDVHRIHMKLYDNKYYTRALWSWSVHFNKRVKPELDPATIKSQLVTLLKRANDEVVKNEEKAFLLLKEEKHVSDAARSTTTTIPLNAMDSIDEGTWRVGMISYPNFGGQDRIFQYPDLRMLYDACDVANVQCKHVFIHRNPLEIIRSTTDKRKFAPKVGQIRMLTLLLDAINGQIMDFPERLLGCWDYNSANVTENGAGIVGTVLGFDQTTKDFQRIFDEQYKTSDPINNVEDIIPNEFQFLYNTLEKTMERTVATCKTIESQIRLKNGA